LPCRRRPLQGAAQADPGAARDAAARDPVPQPGRLRRGGVRCAAGDARLLHPAAHPSGPGRFHRRPRLRSARRRASVAAPLGDVGLLVVWRSLRPAGDDKPFRGAGRTPNDKESATGLDRLSLGVSRRSSLPGTEWLARKPDVSKLLCSSLSPLLPRRPRGKPASGRPRGCRLPLRGLREALSSPSITSPSAAGPAASSVILPPALPSAACRMTRLWAAQYGVGSGAMRYNPAQSVTKGGCVAKPPCGVSTKGVKRMVHTGRKTAIGKDMRKRDSFHR